MAFNRLTSAVSVSVLFMASALGSCSGGKEKQQVTKNQDETPKVEIEQVFSQEVPQTVEYTATVEAYKTNNISASAPNRIKKILVDVGSQVRQGQSVAVLDNAGAEQMKVRLDNAEREYNRAVKLLEIGGGTQQTVDQLKTELDAQRRQYANMMENTVLVSPISGVVTARNYDPGDMTSSLPILTIEQLRPVKVMVNVSESEYPKVHNGMKVGIRLDVYGDEEFTGTVHLIHPTIDPATRTFTVEITIDNADERVRPGMFARVIMNFGVSSHVVVPDRAVVKQSGSGNKYVYVFNPSDSTVSYNRVELGQRLDNTYEVLSGVDNDAYVVITGQTRLADGVKVDVIEKQK